MPVYQPHPKIQVEKKHLFTGHRDCIYTLEKPLEKNIFFSSGGDGMVVAWNIEDPENGELLAKVPNSVYALRFVPESGHLIVGQNFEGLHLIDVKAKKEIRSLKLTNAQIFDIQYFEGNVWVACGDGEVIVVDFATFSKKTSIKHSDKSARALSINPLVREIAVGYSDNSVRIFSLGDFSLQKEIAAHGLSVFAVSYSNDYKYLFTGSRDAHLKVWDCWNHYSLSQSVVAHMYAINDIGFSPDGKFFATASMDKSVKLWSMETFDLLKVLDKSRHAGHATSVNKLLWLATPGLLLSASDDKTISLWKVEEG